MERKYMLILSVLMIIFLMGSASAANTTNVKHSNSQNISNLHFKLISNHYNSTTSTIKKVNGAKNQIVPGYGCCSVLVHVKKGYDVYSFRRDSVYTAPCTLRKLIGTGKMLWKNTRQPTDTFSIQLYPKMDGYLVLEVLISQA
ncbi:MAG: hypothetical protein NKF70_04670 [Methanobacterium sp. ERen5]|nr:MAG: hypothetical protein NKF70_04670 [Methanobacterium sp. ERen5]